MGIITKMRKQKAVYWPCAGVDGYGVPTYGAPVEIDCRWEDAVQEFLNSEGQRELSQAKVYVDRDVTLKGMLMLGELTSGVDPDPNENDGAWEIRRFEKLPNLKATEFLRTVYI